MPFTHKRVSNRDARRYIERREAFETHTGSLWGAYAAQGWASLLGQLPEPYREQHREAYHKVGGALFTVYSYHTPIAWHDGEKWTRPDVKYSPTTSRHQGLTPRDGTKG